MKPVVQIDCPPEVIEEFPRAIDYVLYRMHETAYRYALKVCSGRTVLDWGCNTGYGISILADSALRVGGLDTNEVNVLEARRRYPQYSDMIWLYDGEHIPFPQRDWGAIVSFQVIEHVEHMDAYLGAIRSVLGGGGIALFTTPNRIHRLDPGMRPFNSMHVTEYTASELNDVLKGHFSDVKLLGLQGDPEIARIYLDQCAMYRDGARVRDSRGRLERRIRSTIKSLVPESPLKRLRRDVQNSSSRPGMVRPTPEMIRHLDTLQFYYSDVDVESSLDLLAICS